MAYIMDFISYILYDIKKMDVTESVRYAGREMQD